MRTWCYTADGQYDTIGGGHLEWHAAQIARTMLQADPAEFSAQRKFKRIALGPSLGQCCGGVVFLAFERLDKHSPSGLGDMLDTLEQHWCKAVDVWRAVALESGDATLLYELEGEVCRSLQVTVEAIDVPNTVVDLAEAGAYFLVMTHSHALDQQLSERILQRADIGLVRPAQSPSAGSSNIVYLIAASRRRNSTR